MQIPDILAPSRTQAGVAAGSKKRVLETVAALVSKSLDIGGDTPGNRIPPETIFDALLARERLGSTALGEGVAIPHCRLPGGTVTTGVLLQLAAPVDFDAMDNRPVDLVFALVVPEQATDEHLTLLGRIAALFNDPAAREALRSASSGAALHEAVRMFEKDAAG